MTYATMSDAYRDAAFMTRVTACVQQEARSGASAPTDYALAVKNGQGSEQNVIGWAVVVATEAAYATAVAAATPDPGSAITDAQILAAVQAAWPAEWPPPPPTTAQPRIVSAEAGTPTVIGRFLPVGITVPATLAA